MDKLTADSYRLGYDAGQVTTIRERIVKYDEDDLTLLAEAHWRRSPLQSWAIQRVFTVGFLDGCYDWISEHVPTNEQSERIVV